MSAVNKSVVSKAMIGKNIHRLDATVASLSLLQRRKKSTQTSLLDSAQNLWSQIRFKAVQSVAATLSDSERQTLLQLQTQRGGDTVVVPNQINESNNGTDQVINGDTTPQISIAEAVAQARMDEAQRLTSKWEKDKEQLMEQAEQAARARVENDLMLQRRRLQFEEWKRKLADAQQQPNSVLEKQASELESTVIVAAAKNNHATTTEATNAHPILGAALLDFGYKRIHACSAKNLSDILIWERQRIYRHNRAKAMAADKLKTLHLGIPGIVALFEDKDGNLSILDGQHRVGMMTLLLDKKTNNDSESSGDNGIDLDRILVEVYPHQEAYSNLATELFLEINKAEPVKLVDMPGVAKKADRNIITDAVSRLQDKYAVMFKPSQNCRAPHLNIDNVRDALFAANVLTKNSLKSSKALYDWMMAQNEALEKEYKDALDYDIFKGIPKTAIKKAQANKFYLGLESGWYYH